MLVILCINVYVTNKSQLSLIIIHYCYIIIINNTHLEEVLVRPAGGAHPVVCVGPNAPV